MWCFLEHGINFEGILWARVQGKLCSSDLELGDHKAAGRKWLWMQSDFWPTKDGNHQNFSHRLWTRIFNNETAFQNFRSGAHREYFVGIRADPEAMYNLCLVLKIMYGPG
jgi:hypothetical protein